MKKYSFLLFIFISVLVACTPPAIATPSPTVVFTNTPPATATLEPTQTLEPTPLSIPISEISFDSCREITEAKISSDGRLEVIYDKPYPSQQLWIWSEDTPQAVPLPLPADALNPKPSTDHRWILFQRSTTETQRELWVIGADGKEEKRLATVRLDEAIKARYPDGYFSLEYEWIPNTEKLIYSVDITYGQVPPLIFDKFVLLDANSGRATPLTNPTKIKEFRFSPNGSQMAVQTESELRVLSTRDGREQFTIQAILDNFTYSPNGKFIIDFIDDGLIRVNVEDGQQQTIALKYTILSSQTEPSLYGPSPDFMWTDHSTLLLTSLVSDRRHVFLVPFILKPDPSWTFTIWQIDLASGTTHPIQTFSGDPSTARISLNAKLVAFQKYSIIGESKTRDLYLADLATGEILETIPGSVFEAWYPDSKRYFYTSGVPYPPPGKGDPGSTTEVEIKYYLGQIGKESVRINWDSSALAGLRYSQWVDSNRLLGECKIYTFE